MCWGSAPSPAGGGLLQALPRTPPGTRGLCPLEPQELYRYRQINVCNYAITRLDGSNKWRNCKFYLPQSSFTFVSKIFTVQYPQQHINSKSCLITTC